MTVAITKAIEDGANAVICASTGNTTASAAAYAAGGHALRGAHPRGQDRHGQAVPGIHARGGSHRHRGQLRSGARVRQGDLAAQTHHPGQLAQPLPHRGAEDGRLRDRRDLGDAPAMLSIPVGNAGNITSYWKGFREYQRPRKGRAGCRWCGASRPKGPTRWCGERWWSTPRRWRPPSASATRPSGGSARGRA